MKQLFTGIACLFIFLSARAQKDPEFPKGWVMYLQEHHGIATNFTTSPDLFISGLRLSPQATIVPGLLRLGGTAGAIFNNKKFDGTFGPNAVVKLATMGAPGKGSILNVQLQAEYLWGTNHQKLIGGLLHIELIQLLVVGLSAHRDYGLNTWWFQGGIGYNLLHKKKKDGVFDPFDNIKKK
ncbi:MAG: hypothetical protein ABIR15_16525 [Chitinophagaceae bacterium]